MRPTLARRRSARNRSLCSGTFRRNNSEMLQIEIGRCHSLQPVKEASTGRVDRTVSSPLGYTEHLIRQYQLGNISYYCGGAERCFGSSLNRTFTSVATGVKLTPHYGGVETKTSEFNPAFLEDRYRTVLMSRLKEKQHEARENPEAASAC
jgi:hypothetical protein